MNQGTIFTNITNKVATITFFHPASNSFTSELINKLVVSINRLSQDDKVHVIVIKSDGDKAFCAGASFDELLQVKNLDEGKKFFSGFANLINAMRKCDKLIIGRVQGKTVGGGVGIIAATDYCFATEAADVKLSEFSIGIGPFVIAPAVERKINVSALSELTIDATNWKTAYWAKEKGLFARVFENIRDMDEAVDILTNKLAGYNLQALIEMKKILWHDTNHWDELLLRNAEISGKLALSEFTKNALLKFKK
ncbi:MAG: enoyl-CoA hydratase/isomerase family protein [Flavobacteriaceae bacterium]|nr:enoyl-CoA hydratase/isomerase family protein [Flavobacteriaceae bacterium]